MKFNEATKVWAVTPCLSAGVLADDIVDVLVWITQCDTVMQGLKGIAAA